MGWSTYFAFIFAAINTLTVTYFLAIENYPVLKEVFPTFVIYVIIITAIGIPLLTLIGYVHFKRTPSFRSESAVNFESNPFARRTLINSELTLKINQELITLLLKMQQGEKIDDKIIEQIQKTQPEMSKLVDKRTIFSKEDLDFLKKLQGNN
jgi:predicted XRE-type DNA-binding protein